MIIRDPSDGSVKEKPKPVPTSALAAEKPDELERLERSRAWLKTYHKGEK